MHVTVALQPADPAGLERLAAQVSTPGSALYRHFLRPRQVQERFGPPAAVAAGLRAWLRGRGLAAGATSGDGLLLPATGLVAQVEAAFHTTIERVRLAGGRIAYMNRRAPRVPVSLRSWVTAVVGLNNLVLPQSELVSRSSPAGPGAANAGPTAAKTCAAIRGIPAYTAGQLAHAYKFTALYRRGDSGQHVTVALFELADYSDQDIQAYSHCYQIDPSVRRVRVDGGTSIDANPGGTVEVTADIEVLAAMAPRAHVLVYEAPLSAGDATMDNYGAIVQQDRAQVVSSSWGGCEPLIGATDQRIEARIFQAMAIQGQSMMASAGDSGSEDCLPFVAYLPHRAYRLAVDDPGSQPFVTSVGGTMITTYRSPPAQSAWNQSPGGTGFLAPFDGQSRRPAGYPGNLVGGGGISRLWRMPSWQTGADHTGNASGVSCGAPRGTDCREVPDVSALAAIGTSTTKGYVIYGTAGGFQNEGWLTVGGTSLASPLWASLTALADEQVTPHVLGLLSPSLYRIARDDPRAFTDVTAGANDYLAVGGNPSNDTCRFDGLPDQPCYRATQGYDMATGLGSPEAKYLVADLRNLGDRRASGG